MGDSWLREIRRILDDDEIVALEVNAEYVNGKERHWVFSDAGISQVKGDDDDEEEDEDEDEDGEEDEDGDEDEDEDEDEDRDDEDEDED